MTRTQSLAAALLAAAALTGCQGVWDFLSGGQDKAPAATEPPAAIVAATTCEAELASPDAFEGAHEVWIHCDAGHPVEGVEGTHFIEGDIEAALAAMSAETGVAIAYHGYVPVPMYTEEETDAFAEAEAPPDAVAPEDDVRFGMPSLPPAPAPPPPVEDAPAQAAAPAPAAAPVDDRVAELAPVFGWSEEEAREIQDAFGGDDAALDAFLDQFIVQELESLPAAAAGPGYTEMCQAEIGRPGQLLVTCRNTMTERFRQTEVPIDGAPVATLTTLARELGGPGFDVGNVDATLCVWGNLPLDPEHHYYWACPEWEYQYSDLARQDAESFDTGRIAHHAPEGMVLDQPYFLEVAIQPLQASSDIEAVDTTLMSTMGTGLAPGIETPALDLGFDTISASNVMSAQAIGSGYDIVATTPAEQVLVAGEPTVWQWQVTPKEAGTPILTFTISQSVDVNGRSVLRTVKTIPMSVKVTPLDELLADPGAQVASTPAPEGTGFRTALSSGGNPVVPALDNAGSASATMRSASAGPAAPDIEIAGCTWHAGADPDRQALVLSNLGYSPPLSRLSVTHEDGVRMSGALQEVGFSVLQCEDLGQRSTVRALSMLGRLSKARKDAGAHPVTFFYYSGHGVNIDGTNFILPTDIPGASPDDIRDGGVSFEDIFNRVSSTVAPTSFVVFDACRTVMDDQSRGLMRAYSPVGWASGVFQAFATEPGKTAADDGVYSQELARLMQDLADPANVLFKRVQDAVAARTGQKQRPVYTDGTTGGDFYFQRDASE